MINRRKEFSRDLEKGIIKNIERAISIPKIDVNTEKKYFFFIYPRRIKIFRTINYG